MDSDLSEIKEELRISSEELGGVVKRLDQAAGMIGEGWEGESERNFMRKYDELVREVDLAGRKIAALSDAIGQN